MELTRVTSGKTAHKPSVAASGGAADVLALLLGGDQSEPASKFPATLTAALAGGEVAEDPIATPAGSGAGDGALEGEKAGDGATAIGLAVAAALALGGAPTTATGVGPAAAASSGATKAGAAGAVASAVVGTTTATTTAGGGKTSVANGNAVAAPAATTAATTAAVTVTVTVTSAQPESADQDAEAAPGANAAAARLERLGPDGAKAATAGTVTTSGDGTAAKNGSDAIVSGASSAADVAPAQAAGPHAEGGTGHHGAGAGLAVEPTASFASGAGEHHGLDLGSSERHPNAVPVAEKPAHAAAATVPAAAAQAPAAQASATGAPDALPQTQPNGRDAAPSAPPVTTTSGTTVAAGRESTSARLDLAAQHPGGIEPRWSERVADAVRLSALRGGGEIRLQLEPEGLGHIDVRIHLRSDGVHAAIVAQHESTRALLTSQQQALHDAFQRSDLRLSGFSVDVGSDGRAASFARPDDQGRGDAAPAAPRPSGVTTAAADVLDGATVAAASGHVSVRV